MYLFMMFSLFTRVMQSNISLYQWLSPKEKEYVMEITKGEPIVCIYV